MTPADGGAAGVLWKGMKAYGPSHPDYPNKPQDWDGGAYLCRDGQMYWMRGYGWEHGIGCYNATADWDRIAYKPLADAMPAERAK